MRLAPFPASIILAWVTWVNCGTLAHGEIPDLRVFQEVQKKVQTSLPNVSKAIVAIECSGGTASGVIVNASGLILTAAHVSGAANKKIKITLSTGKTVEGDSLGLDTTTDAAMVKLPPAAKGWPFVPINNDVRGLLPGMWCFALGHPGGYDAARGPVLRVGKLVKVGSNMMQSDCVLMGGDSGGALFNLKGELIGIHSQIWQGLDQNLHVTMAPFLRSWEAMKKGDTIRVLSHGSGGWIGLSTKVEGDRLLIQGVAPGSPAEKAGMKTGDVIVSVNHAKTTTPAEFSDMIRYRTAGQIISVEIAAPEGARFLTVKLAQRPQE